MSGLRRRGSVGAGGVVLAFVALGGCGQKKPPSNEDAFGHPPARHAQPGPALRGSGTIMALDEVGHTLRINHTAIPELKLGSGATTFRYVGDLPGATAAGDNVSFEIEVRKGQPVISGIGSPLAN